tara:strand:- start:1734 stop:2192 length:459 start_codon:yes stop_codon:yes gene_type:complete
MTGFAWGGGDPNIITTTNTTPVVGNLTTGGSGAVLTTDGSSSAGVTWGYPRMEFDDGDSIKKFLVSDMCKSRLELSSEIIRNLVAMNVSLMTTLVEKNIIEEKDLEKNFKQIKKYTDLMKTADNENNEEDLLRKEVAKGIESNFPKFLKKEL